MLTMTSALDKIKARLADAVSEELIYHLRRDSGYRWRDRHLGPVLTTHLFLQQILHGNIAAAELRHLKQTLHMDVLHCQTVEGVVKELTLFIMIYNLVREVMWEASRRQKVLVERISFVDAWRWLRHAQPGDSLPVLVVNPERRGRAEPRVRKRRPKEFPLVKRLRDVLRNELLAKRLAA